MPSPLDDARALALEPAPTLEGYAAADLPGPLGDLARWLASLPGADADRPDARLRRPIAALYVTACADAGPDAAEHARTRMEALGAGTAPAAALARAQGAGLELFDLALARPAPDGAQRSVMSERECAGTLAFGLEALAKTPDLLVLACAAPGEARRAARLGCALAGDDPAAGGEGDPDRAAAIDRALAAAGSDPLQLLRQLGGRETAAMAGALLAARDQATPVLLDGEAALAAAAVLHALAPSAIDHARLAARPASHAGARLAERLGLTPILDLAISEPEGVAGLAALATCRLAADLNAAAVRR